MKFNTCKSYNRTCPCWGCRGRYKCARACNKQKPENGIVVDTDLLCDIAKEYCEKTHSYEMNNEERP